MPTIFLSHTSIDKPFVEKLAKDLNNLGINVWYDKYEIKVGESILWKIDEGIRESEYLGIVISKEALKSEWVKTEISSAWQKQVKQNGNFVLPIYYRDCEMPLFLEGLKYADFRSDYNQGLSDLVKVFGIKDLDIITEDNWRIFAKKRKGNWQQFRDREYSEVVTRVCDIAREFNFGVWTGRSKNPYSFVIRGWITREQKISISVRMDSTKGYRYIGADTEEWNPNNIDKKDYQIEIGSTVNEVEEYIYDRVSEFVAKYGRPQGVPNMFTSKKIDTEETMQKIMEVFTDANWDKHSRIM